MASNAGFVWHRRMLLGVSETDQQDLTDSTSIWFGIADTWLDIYRKRHFAVIDPMVRMALQEDRIIEWGEAFDRYRHDAQEFIDLSRKYGLYSGYAIGRSSHQIAHTASVSSVTFDPHVVTVAQLALMKIIFPHLNDILTRPGFLRRPALTRQQLRVLEWADKKKTHVQTAHIMGISERTVRFHFNNIYNKYGVNDKAGAIAKAKMYGQLH